MIWSDHEEELLQLRRRRARILSRLMLAALASFAAAMILGLSGHDHGGYGVVADLAFAGFLLALGATAWLGGRWRMNSNTAESRSATRERKAARKAQVTRREQAIREAPGGHGPE